MDFSSFRTFFLGKQDKSNRESAMFFYGPDLLSIKWRNFKVHFSVRERPRGDVRMPGQQEVTSYSVEPTYSLGLRCCERPQEAVELGLSNTWVGERAAKIAVEYQKSLQKHPNIEPGAEGPK